MDNRIQGKTGYPLHDDGCPVITHRLKTKLKPLELYLYSSPGLTRILYERLYADVGDDTYDSWALEDFVAYGLEQAVQYGWQDSPGAVVHWCRQKLWRKKKRQKRYLLTNDFYPEQIEPDILPNRLPEEVHDWLVWHCPTEVAEVFVVASEKDIPLSQAADLLGADFTQVQRACRRLRQLIKDENDA